MPNHISNKLTVLGTQEQIKKVMDFIKIEKQDESQEVFGIGTIDFNKITPCPPWVFQGNLGVREEEKYGKENCWYEWNCKNWGTKWNAYNQSMIMKKDNVLEFQTAWNGVPKLIEKIAWIFPDVEFEYEFADEDTGYNVGRYKFKDTKFEDNSPKNGTKEAYELAFELNEIDYKDYGYVYDEAKGTYIYVECEEN